MASENRVLGAFKDVWHPSSMASKACLKTMSLQTNVPC